MPAMKCPHCGYHSNLTQRWHRDSQGSDRWDYRAAQACYTCDHCEMPIAAVLPDEPWDKGGAYWPSRAWGKNFPDVPEALAAAANEAHICLSAGSSRGAVALARSVLESVAKDKGITKGNLRSKIDKLHAAGHISEAMSEAAHEIRFAGNEAAHGDLVAEQLKIEDAEEIVALMDAVLERVYQEPAQVARIREKRERRNKELEAAVPTFSDEPPF
jgi:phage terminase large subunit GpA-like protein